MLNTLLLSTAYGHGRTCRRLDPVANDPERTSRAIAVSHGRVDNEQPKCYPAMRQDHHLQVECLNL